jgi:hypothetical protein
LERIHWINRDKLIDFILSAQVRRRWLDVLGTLVLMRRIWKAEV